jgi:hypothetical protein
MSCPYANILGRPRTGVHSIRVLDFAIVDVLMTLLLALVSFAILRVSLFPLIILWFAIGILMHALFGVQTQLFTLLNIDICK